MRSNSRIKLECDTARVRFKKRDGVLTIGGARLSDFDGELLFDGSFGFEDVDNQLRGGIPWENDERIQHVRIVEDVTLRDGCFLFAGLSGLQSFQGLEKLHVVGDADFMFGGCPLDHLDLHELDVSHITSISYIFNGAQAKTIDVTGWNTANIFSFAGTFLCCEQLETIKGIEGWDVAKAYSMNSMFRHCCALRSLDLRKWDMSNVADTSNMFMHAKSLSKLQANFNLESVKNTSFMFAGCSSLGALSLESKDWILPLRCKTNSMFLNSGIRLECYPKNYQLEIGDSLEL